VTGSARGIGGGIASELLRAGALVVIGASPRTRWSRPAGSLPRLAWALHESTLNLDVLSQTESLFALSNGHIGLRGNLDEGEPHGLPGSYHQRDERQAVPLARG
jgi:NAD(P)-dependent dehydrogenase (short-subunit alcohol dehydrogenase family)